MLFVTSLYYTMRRVGMQGEIHRSSPSVRHPEIRYADKKLRLDKLFSMLYNQQRKAGQSPLLSFITGTVIFMSAFRYDKVTVFVLP